MKRNHRVNNATLPPLTPTIPALTPTRPTVTPDTRVESFLWNLYLEQKSRADWAHRRFEAIEKKFSTYRARRVARGLAGNLKPNHNPKETQ